VAPCLPPPLVFVPHQHGQFLALPLLPALWRNLVADRARRIVGVALWGDTYGGDDVVFIVGVGQGMVSHVLFNFCIVQHRHLEVFTRPKGRRDGGVFLELD
jgi:hypothetical protein